MYLKPYILFYVFHVVCGLHYDIPPLRTRTYSGMCRSCRCSLSPLMSPLSLHFEYIHSFHRNHCRHLIHHILCSLSSYSWPLSSVVVSFPSLFLVFINLDLFPDLSCLIGFWLDRIRIRPNQNWLIVFY